MKPYDLIIFDMDGTLYPVTPSIDSVYPEVAILLAARSSGLSVSETRKEFLEKKNELGSRLKGRPTNTLTLLYYYDVSLEEFEKEIDSRLKIESLLSPDKQTINAIKAISKSYKTVLYTTNNAKTTQRILSVLRLDKYFETSNRFTLTWAGKMGRTNRDIIDFIKPGKKGFETILKMFNTVPGKVLMVGDSTVSDIRPAKALGMDTYQILCRDDLYDLPHWLEIKQK